MTDQQMLNVLRDIESQMRKVNKKLDEVKSSVEQVERAIWETTPEK